MKHNLRINGQVKTINFELGSGILDKNGNEIFFGDKVKMFYKEYPLECQPMLVFYEIDDTWSDCLEISNDNN